MLIKAIMDQLATGSITNIITRGNREAYPAGKNFIDNNEPYVIVANDYPVNSYYITDNTIEPIIIEAHFPVGYINELNKYVEEELMQLLNRKRLTDSDGFNFQVYGTMHISIMDEPNDDKSISGGNDDGSISRYRRFFIPLRGL